MCPAWQARGVPLLTLFLSPEGLEAAVHLRSYHGARALDVMAEAHAHLRELLKQRDFVPAAALGRKLVFARLHALGACHADTLMTQRFLVSALTQIGSVDEADQIQRSSEARGIRTPSRPPTRQAPAAASDLVPEGWAVAPLLRQWRTRGSQRSTGCSGRRYRPR